MTNTLTTKQEKVMDTKLDKIAAALQENKFQLMKFLVQYNDLIEEDDEMAYDFVLYVYSQMFYRNGRITKNKVEFKNPSIIKIIGFYIGYFGFLLEEKLNSKTKLTRLSNKFRKIYDEMVEHFDPDLSDDQKLIWDLAYTYKEFLHMHQFYYNLALNEREDDPEDADSRQYDTFVANVASAYNSRSLAEFEKHAAKEYAKWLKYATNNYQYAFWEF